ncbi:MAG: phosphoribosylglycinamide formyltransferase [bacterium]|nr:phosphoribosylglycinamide formyltransferase [bacterium]
MVRLALFASGSGSNAENIARYFHNREDVAVSLIVSNKADAYVHNRASCLGIPSHTLSREAFVEGKEVLDLLRRYRIDFVVLAGFLLKVPQSLLDAYPRRMVNIHPALLPRYGGKGMYGDRVHRAVVEAGEKESGITIHYINEHYDEGDIIFQARCPLLPGDTPEDLAAKVHALEYAYYPEVIDSILKKSKEENQPFDK